MITNLNVRQICQYTPAQTFINSITVGSVFHQQSKCHVWVKNKPIMDRITTQKIVTNGCQLSSRVDQATMCCSIPGPIPTRRAAF